MQKRVDVVNMPMLELETFQRPACLELEKLLAFPAAGSSKDDNTATVQADCINSGDGYLSFSYCYSDKDSICICSKL